MIEMIERLAVERVDWLADEFARRAWPKPAGYFQDCHKAQARDEMVVLVSRCDDRLHGYLKVVWESSYNGFKCDEIPEIQDLNVVPESRRRGVASRLMDAAEELVSKRSPVVGIGVGLHPGYGPAQRMYVLRGFVPDARPLTYNDEPVCAGQIVTLDDGLNLHLVKNLKSH